MTEALSVTAVLDASVLYPALLRNMLMLLALHGLFCARWSERIHEEWIVALLRNRPDLTRARVEHTRNLMDLHVQDALVDGYESRIEALTLPDADDRHVVAAAIHCGANVILTTNLKGEHARTSELSGAPAPGIKPHAARVTDRTSIVSRCQAKPSSRRTSVSLP